jgi:hypothetical protein
MRMQCDRMPRVLDCRSGGCGFESRRPRFCLSLCLLLLVLPHLTFLRHWSDVGLLPIMTTNDCQNGHIATFPYCDRAATKWAKGRSPCSYWRSSFSKHANTHRPPRTTTAFECRRPQTPLTTRPRSAAESRQLAPLSGKPPTAARQSPPCSPSVTPTPTFSQPTPPKKSAHAAKISGYANRLPSGKSTWPSYETETAEKAPLGLKLGRLHKVCGTTYKDLRRGPRLFQLSQTEDLAMS